MERPDLSIVIPALNAAETLPGTLAALADPHSKSLSTEVVLVDGGSTDATVPLAAAQGVTVISSPAGRGLQLETGAKAASGPWLLFLHADTRLAPGWIDAARDFQGGDRADDKAAVFTLQLNDGDPRARRIERLAAWRARRLGLPYGDQGLLISRSFYDRVGGYRPLPLMEDVDLVRRIGRERLVTLPVAAITSAIRYRRDGWWLRPARNLCVLGLYFLGVPSTLLRRLYG